jgi:hypothetical protein
LIGSQKGKDSMKVPSPNLLKENSNYKAQLLAGRKGVQALLLIS